MGGLESFSRRFRHWRQTHIHRAGVHRDRIEERGLLQQWILLAGWCDRDRWSAPDPASLTPIYPPPGSFWADPFVWSRDERWYIFFEDYRYAYRRGHIGCIELDRSLRPVGPPVPVVARPWHLSYPFLLELDGSLYMVPESAGAQRVDIYRCESFPDRWTQVKTPISGLGLADPTVFAHGGRWWLLGSARQGRARLSETLVAFYADHPLSDRWIGHPSNPLLVDYRWSRPAGRVFHDSEGRLLRPAQDCLRRYGHGIGLSEITELSERRYSERRIWQTTGEEAGGWRALHHLDWHRGLMAMDAQRLIAAETAPTTQSP